MNILIVGTGAMGTSLANEILKTQHTFATTDTCKNVAGSFDVIIDFSHHSNIGNICSFATEHNIAVVIGTTGYSQEQFEQIELLSKKVPVVYSANYSVGIVLLKRIAASVAKTLANDFDIEIIEKHHNQKADAPSGTATMLLNAIDEQKNFSPIYGRKGSNKRTKNEIGIHSIRGGSIIGEHTVLFAGQAQSLTITHQAHNKSIFATGAIQAATWVIEKKAGLYNMEDVLGV